MAIGTTESFDPETGERRQTQFEYTPVDPQDEMMRQAFERSQQAFYPAPPQPQGPTPYWENPETYYPQQRGPDPVAQAKAATAAAYKYIAMRGYQQDLKEGKSAADAFAKWGPMLVQDVSFAPAMKALTPTPQPTWMPANAATGQPGTWIAGGRALVPPMQGQETVIAPTGQNPGYIRDAKGGIHFLPKESPDKLDPFVKADYDRVADDYDRASKVANDTGETVETRKDAIARMGVYLERLNRIKRNAQSGDQQSAPTAPPASVTIKKFVYNPKTGKIE